MRRSHTGAADIDRHCEPPLGGAAIQDLTDGAAALDCFVASLLAMTSLGQWKGQWFRHLVSISKRRVKLHRLGAIAMDGEVRTSRTVLRLWIASSLRSSQ
jgi:hypothetical protein